MSEREHLIAHNSNVTNYNRDNITTSVVSSTYFSETLQGSRHYAASDDALCTSFRQLSNGISIGMAIWAFSYCTWWGYVAVNVGNTSLSSPVELMLAGRTPAANLLVPFWLGCAANAVTLFLAFKRVRDARLVPSDYRLICRNLGVLTDSQMIDQRSIPLLRKFVFLSAAAAFATLMLFVSSLLLHSASLATRCGQGSPGQCAMSSMVLVRASIPVVVVYFCGLLYLSLKRSVSAVSCVMYLLLGIEAVRRDT